MRQGKIKNVILVAMVLVCIYLSSKVWLKLPNFLERNIDGEENNSHDEVIAGDLWNVVRPTKNIIKYNEDYTITYSDELHLWGKTVQVINDAFNSFDSSSVNESAAFPSQYLKFDFSTNVPVEIFTGHMKIDNRHINDKINCIKNIIIDLEDASSIYIYNGVNTIKIKDDSIDTQEISEMVKQIDFSTETEFAFDQKIGEKTIQVPVPLETTALSPIFVQSELDVFDTESIDKIAKNYFKNNYDYVRKSVEVNGNLIYMYRTKKIFKINSDGLLDLYDTTGELENSSDVYRSLVTAVNFANEFLGFPEDGYLSNVESIEHDGNYGYRYTFSYKILERPIMFSKVRENSALKIDVIGDSVISYKRFIRKIDKSQIEKMSTIQILPAIDVIAKNLGDDSEVVNNSDDVLPELKPLSKDIIKEISSIYLGYYDLSRILKEQALRVVWVIEAGDKTYIFNAKSGLLIEEW